MYTKINIQRRKKKTEPESIKQERDKKNTENKQAKNLYFKIIKFGGAQ